jgi:hypothetical protein
MGKSTTCLINFCFNYKCICFSSHVMIFNNKQKLSHNCVPNTKWTELSKDKNGKYLTALGIRVLATVPIKKGELLKKLADFGNGTVINVLEGTCIRRQTLLREGVDCRCERCMDPTELGTYISGN